VYYACKLKNAVGIRAKISQFTSLSVIYTDRYTFKLLLYTIALEKQNNHIVLLNMHITSLETPEQGAIQQMMLRYL
jgi:hypothetical protein